MKLPKSITDLTGYFEKLPGIGPKSAARLAFYILKSEKYEVDKFANALVDVKQNLQFCSVCHNVSENELCEVCNDTSRDKNILCVVENVLNLIAIENTGYNGLYHVLGGVLNPVNGINIEDINITDITPRIKQMLKHNQNVELILATNPTMEGESTAMYIKTLVDKSDFKDKVKITRIGRGLPTGGDIEFADKTTLDNAFAGRVVF